MKASTRLLVTFGISIGVLVIVTVVLALTLSGGQDTALLPEDTPEGTVQRYLRAYQAEDYQKAYSYLSPDALAEQSYYTTYENWSQAYPWRRGSLGWKATLGNATVTGDEATMTVIIDVFRPEVPFADPTQSRQYNFQLKKEGTSWKITSPIYPLYLY